MKMENTGDQREKKVTACVRKVYSYCIRQRKQKITEKTKEKKRM